MSCPGQIKPTKVFFVLFIKIKNKLYFYFVNTPPNRKPHDEFFKTTFSNQRVAEAYIRRFLPSPLVKNLQLEKLELAKASYISKQLKPYFSDIVYTCPYHDDTINLSFLYEHKSYPVAYPHIQILRYILEVWERNIREKNPLQITVPMLFYHGQLDWEYQPFSNYFPGLDDVLSRYIPTFDYEFLNIREWPDERILKLREAFLVNALLVFKHIWDESYIQKNINQFFIFLEEHMDKPEGENFVERIFVYLIRSSVFENVKLKDMVDNIKDSFRKPAKSAYDRLIGEGIKEGMQKGIKEGIKEGKKEGLKEGKELGEAEKTLRFFKNMHLEGFDLPTISRLLGLTHAQAEVLLAKLIQEGDIPLPQK